MGEIVAFQKPQPDRLSPVEFKNIVRELIAEGRITVSRHLYRDHPERNISQSEIERCLILGVVQEGPFVNSKGNHQATVVRVVAGQRLSVASAIQWRQRVIVITAF